LGFRSSWTFRREVTALLASLPTLRLPWIRALQPNGGWCENRFRPGGGVDNRQAPF
jgi:hypothetical protein